MSEQSAPTSADAGIGRLAKLINGDAMSRLDADMKHVLDAMTQLGARPLEYSSPQSARRQPNFTDAVRSILSRQMREPQDGGVETENLTIDTGEQQLSVRLYKPVGLLNRLNPAVLFFHGGGFVTGSLDSNDDSARAIARRTGALVISAGYRLAPEHKFPAAHEDAWQAWRWVLSEAGSLGVDPRRLVVAGEDAGGNLAANVALRARDERTIQPLHQLLIHPIAGSDLGTPSYNDCQRVRPIGLAAMRWRFRHLLEEQDAIHDRRIDLVSRSDWVGGAPATIILAGVDPLRSEGEALADALESAGVSVQCRMYQGVTQGFFGLGLMVTKALFAQADAADILARAFAPSRRS
ncbi:MAG TPA: alpha/beta hydrolase [Devosia sp.]|jgi:acetyl esterase|nr:alpha/beta hydrolase [Devosia sp.]